MSTAGPLNDRPKKELAEMARRRGVRGWDAMDKAGLVRALSRLAAKPAAAPKPKAAAKPALKPVTAPRLVKPAPVPKPAAKSAAKVTRPVKPLPVPLRPAAPAAAANGAHRPAAVNGSKPAAKPAEPAKPVPPARPLVAKPAAPAREPAARAALPPGPTKDRIFIAVPDPHWLHVIWELSAQSVQRAEAALRQDWYGAKLVIRLSDVTSVDTTSTSETPIRDIEVGPDCTTWYLNVPQPPRQYRVDVGYKSRRGDFFVLARSNVVTPPKAGASDALDTPFTFDLKQAERTLARSTGFESAGNPELREFFEERLKRSLGAPRETAFGTGATPPGSLKKFFFDIDARLVVYGRTDPAAHLTLGNDPVSLKPDGTFAMWFSLPDSRQIIPAVATSVDGVEERTIVLAVERNTKYLDPMIHDQMTE
ncbi:MAG: DUF4912 domain-containing protein [Isosphaera sp.]|nr:DUF4912 domain-containing protein [Isosphaera sp.]